MIEKSTVINRCVIGSFQLNVLVSLLVIAVPSFSTQDKAIWLRLKIVLSRALCDVRGSRLSLTIQSGCVFDNVQMTGALFAHHKVSGSLFTDGGSFQPQDEEI